MKASALALAIAIGACHGDGASRSAPLPADRQCLPLNVCDQWKGCALVARASSVWSIVAADGFAPGDLVEVKNVCTVGATCIAVRGAPKGVVCPAWSVPPLIAPPGYRCAWDGRVCRYVR